MIDEDQVRAIAKKTLNEEHLLGFIKTFEKEHNLFRGSHDKIQLPAALNVPQQVVNTISGKTKFEDLQDVSIPTKAVGDFIQYNETTEKWTRQAALTEGSIVIAVADGYFSEDNTNFTWDNTSKIFKVIGSIFLDGAVVINDSNADVDFRVEGSGATYTHLLFTDASANKVGINEDAPKALLHVRHGTCANYAGVHPYTALLLEGTSYVALQLQGSSTTAANIIFADDNYNPPAGRIQYNFNTDEMNFSIGMGVRVFFTTTGARFVQNQLEIDSATGTAYFTANSHDADAYFALEEDEAIKWSMGFDYSDSLKFQISAGIPGTNVCLEIEAALINLYLDVGIWGSQDLRFYGADDHYVGFKVPAGLTGDQIWVLPAADGAAGEVLSTSGAGVLSWVAGGGAHAMATHTDEDTYNIVTTGYISTGTTPSTVGQIRLPNNTGIRCRNAANDGDLVLVEIDSADRCHIGYATVQTNLSYVLGKVFVGAQYANTKMAKGITIQQGAEDDEILAFKSSDIAHGMTTYAETDTYANFAKISALTGGVVFTGYGESTWGVYLNAYYTDDNTDKDNSAIAPIAVNAWKADGVGRQVQGADANTFVIRSGNSTRFIVDEDGDILFDGTHGAYQDHDDIELLAEIEVNLDKSKKLKSKEKYNKQDLKDLKLLRPFVSTKGLNMLLFGAIRQLNKKIEALEAQLNN